jgi:hypothetical protein
MAAISPRDVLKAFRGELHHREKPVNDVKYNTVYYGRRVNGPQFPWCGTAIFWVFLQCGVDLRERGIRNAASTNAFDADCARMGWRRVPKEKAQAGDVVFYDFGDLGAGDVAGDNDHVGICSKAASGGFLWALEGNTDGQGSRTGGQVLEQHRRLGLVRHVYRPPYGDWSKDLGAKPQSVEDDMPSAKEVAEALLDADVPLTPGAARDLNVRGKRPSQTVRQLLMYGGSLDARLLAYQAARFAALTSALQQVTGGAVDLAKVQEAAKAGAEEALGEVLSDAFQAAADAAQAD